MHMGFDTEVDMPNLRYLAFTENKEMVEVADCNRLLSYIGELLIKML